MAKRTIEMKWLFNHIAVIAALLILAPISCKTETERNLKQADSNKSKSKNRLAKESSPYLLQHADNPVDWYPWGEEALNKAKAEDKPIFLSIGYSACHWCHVMAHESFENPEIAALMNANFINIKVDREERPDLDEIYISFTTAMTGSGGWPMSVFLTPDLKPFYAGTYFPPDDRYGRPGFAKVLAQLDEVYKTRKAELIESSENIFKALSEQAHTDVKQSELDQNALSKSCEQLYSNFDRENGGFGTQPKFPHPTELSLFLRLHNRSKDSRFLNAADLALKNMARGGIYDQIGGGFHRYATDNKWLVPHFEKMLYDNALLLPVYADAYQITKDAFYLKVIRETLDFLLREMNSPEGAFYSALDADSEGEEGKFYVWDINEIKGALGSEAESFIQYYNVTSNGNFEGHNILNITANSEQNFQEFESKIEKSKTILLETRAKRVRPHTDDKILTSWNGLAISAFCRGYQVTGEKRFLEAAIKCATFINEKLYRKGKLTHSYRESVHSGSEFLEDYSFLIRGLLDLYESDNKSENDKWINWSLELADSAIKLFQDEKGRFYLRPDGNDDLIFRPKEVRDGAIPSAGSIMLGNLLKLNRITGNSQYLNAAEKGLKALSGNVQEYPAGMASAVSALDYYFQDKIEIVISGKGENLAELLTAVYQQYLPNRVIAFDTSNKSKLPLFEGRRSDSGEIRAYVCRNSVCRLPVTTVEALKNQLNEL